MDEVAWAHYQAQIKKSEEIKQCIIELYGTYNGQTVTQARRDGLIDLNDKMQLKRNCPY